MSGFLTRLHTDYMALANGDRARHEDEERANRIRYEGMRDHGIKALSDSLGCSVAEAGELVSQTAFNRFCPEALYTANVFAQYEVRFNLTIPGVWISVRQSKATGDRIVSIYDDGADEGMQLPAARETTLRMIGAALDAAWSDEP